ncbi:hypothetical protein CR513_42172, partial [Mucuna pruriens]
MDRSMIDVASGGALIDKTLATARHMISNIASNTQKFGIKGPSQSRMVNEIGVASNLRLENQLFELTSLVRQLAVGQHQPNMAAKVCGVCTSMEHPTNLCPTTKSRALCSVEIQTYVECTSRISRLPIVEPAISSTTFPTAAVENATSRQFSIFGGPNEATCSQQFGVSAIFPTKYERHHPRPQDSAGSSNLPSQTIPNQRGNASVVTLRSGKELSQPAPQLVRSTEANSESDANSQVQQQEKTVPLLFPTQIVSVRKSESNEELLKIFLKVEINIPLLDAIKQMPKYAKFLKELCVHKRKKMKGSVEVGGIVSTLTKNEDFTTQVQELSKKC